MREEAPQRRKRSKDRDEASLFLAMYSDYSRTLRAWLVAYGIGGPVLFLTQEHINSKVAESGQGRWIVYLFLAGVSLQILIALINKWVNWYLYAYEDQDEDAQPWHYRVASWICDKFYIDIVCDIGSVVAFTWATLKALLIFA